MLINHFSSIPTYQNSIRIKDQEKKLEAIEKRITELMKAKDKEAISLLYDHYSDALYGIVIRIVKEEAIARDIMQESFIKVWRNIDRYDPKKARLFTWLLRIFRNSAIDQLRKMQNSKDHKIQISSRNVGKSKYLEMNPETLDLAFHLNKIDVKFRRVLEKIYMEGFTQCETSEALEIPLGTVKSRVRLGLAALRKIYIPMLLLFLNISA